jgi:hypothetical protein
MSCFSTPRLDEYGRGKFKHAPVRQALLTVKTSMIQGVKVSAKSKIEFVILNDDGLFYFEASNPEANDKVQNYILMNEPGWEQTEIVDHKLKKFAICITTQFSKSELHFRDFNELDLWKKSIINTHKRKQLSMTKNNGQVTASATANNNSDNLFGDEGSSNSNSGIELQSDFGITANTKITILSMIIPATSELEQASNDDDKVEELEFFCKIIMGNDVYKTETVSIANVPKSKIKSNKKTTTFILADKEGEEKATFTFHKVSTPNVLTIILYQKKRRNKDNNFTVRGVLNLDVDCARSSGDIRDSFTPRPSDILCQPEKSLSVSVIVRTRYDSESLKKVTFGAPLNAVMDRFTGNQRMVVPDVMYQCLAYLWKHSLKTQGIFRVSGNKNRMRSYVTELDQSPSGTLPLKKFEDEHTVAGIMKLYLRELPEPLISFDKYEAMLIAGGAPPDILKPMDKSNPLSAINAIKQFASASATKDLEQPPLDNTLQQLRRLTESLPESHYLLLKYTCHLLHCITHHSDVNFMKPTNLAIVFGPVFATPSNDLDISKQEMLTRHLPYLSRSTEIMIVNWNDVFPNSRGMLELIECNNYYDQYVRLRNQAQSENSSSSSVNEVQN